jgi:hypothetical protein
MNRYVVATAIVAALVIATAVAFALRGNGDGATSAGTVPTSGAGTPSVIPTAQAPCSPRTFLAVLRRDLAPAGGARQIAGVRVRDCRNDYARVDTVSDKSNCPPTCNQSIEVYLRWTAGRWRILDYGTGIECEDTTSLPPLPAPIRRACRALGYRQPVILVASTFQMPSGNIGCALTGTALRCDILSGLKPEPKRACELDWVGLVLPAVGAPEPHCAGDTVYDQSAPILAYGDMWHGPDFWCESQRDGLLCMSTTAGGGSFHLAREGWEGG